MYNVCLVVVDHRITVYNVNEKGSELIYIRGEKNFEYVSEKLMDLLEFLKEEIQAYLNCGSEDISYAYFGNLSPEEMKAFEYNEDYNDNDPRKRHKGLNAVEFTYKQYMRKVLTALNTQGKLIEDHGINLLGKRYRITQDNELLSIELYDLLGYNVDLNEFMNCIQ